MASVLSCLTLVNRLALSRNVDKIFKPIAVSNIIQTRSLNPPGRIRIDTIDPKTLPEYKVSSDPKEWEHVERLIPLQVVPKPKQFSGPSPSGWIPPREEAKKLPYFVNRTKNHMLPIYLNDTFRGMRLITCLKRIDGDIWALHNELKDYIIEKKYPDCKWKFACKVNEMSQVLKFRGDHVELIKQFLHAKGF